MKLASGARLGPYEILAPVGAGGMGEVYKALDTRLGREVAVKVLPDAFVSDPGRLARFEIEARALAALNHPNICTLHDVGPDYLVMEYVEGSPLKGPLNMDEALRVAVQIAGALAFAHSRGVLHRDLKPGNILAAPGGRVKILDFGLARFSPPSPPGDVTLTSPHTLPGTVIGTAAYMSPEQAAGGAVDARSDIFSFGAVLYELLTGRRAFDGGSPAATLAAVLAGSPLRFQEAGCLAPRGLEELVFRCLEKSLEARWPSMASVASELEILASRGPASAGEAHDGLVVLPFANLSSDPENEYFSDGLTDEIINLLTRVSGIRVIARTSAFAFKGRHCPLREVAGTLGVAYVLEGGVRKSGNHIRVTAQLLRAAGETPLWSGRFDRELTDIFAVQDEIAGAIEAALQAPLAGGARPANVPTRNMEAHGFYLHGVHHVCRWEPTLAENCFERAVELDSGFAPAGAQLANLILGLVATGTRSPREVYPRARAILHRALAADPLLGEAHSCLALVEAVHDYGWESAAHRFRRAFELGAGSWAHHHHGYVLMFQGRIEAARDALLRAVQADPLAAMHRSLLSCLLLFSGRVNDAVHQYVEALRAAPGAWFAAGGLGFCDAFLGRREQGFRLMEEAVEASPGITWLDGWLVKAYVDAGRGRQAESLLGRTFDRLQGYPHHSMVAVMYAALGDTPRALDLLEQAVESREPQLALLAADPVYASVRADPRYAALRNSMNLPC